MTPGDGARIDAPGRGEWGENPLAKPPLKGVKVEALL